MRDERLELRREKLEAAGFTDDAEKERFYVAGTGYFFELTYDEVAEYNAADFKAYLESAAAKIEEVTRAAQEAEQQKQTPAPAEEQEAAAQDANAETTPATGGGYTGGYRSEPQGDTGGNSSLEIDFFNLRAYYTAVLDVTPAVLLTKEAGELYAGFKNDLKHAVDKLENDINATLQNG